jgi:hypothetical protein
MQTKQVTCNTDVFTIKKLSPIDFMGGSSLPFCPIVEIKPKTKHEIMMEDISKEDSNNEVSEDDFVAHIELMKPVIKQSVQGMNGHEVDFNNLFKIENIIKLYKIYEECLFFCFDKFKNKIEMSSTNIQNIYLMAKACSKSPIEILFPTRGYSEMDAYVFNFFIVSKGLAKESQEINRINKKNSKSRR